jgi:hypothetical protein
LAKVSLGSSLGPARFEVLANSFIVFDDAKVMVETISAELTITQSREIALPKISIELLMISMVMVPPSAGATTPTEGLYAGTEIEFRSWRAFS